MPAARGKSKAAEVVAAPKAAASTAAAPKLAARKVAAPAQAPAASMLDVAQLTEEQRGALLAQLQAMAAAPAGKSKKK